MGKQLRNWRMPSGVFTSNVVKYARAWQAFGRPFSKLTGCPIGGFDPSVNFGLHRKKKNEKVVLVSSAQLPFWLVNKINIGLAKLQDKHDKEIAKLRAEIEHLKSEKEETYFG